MFGRKNKTESEPEQLDRDDAVTEADQEASQKKLPEKKGVPTPTRKEQEAARKRPLVGNDRKAARKRERERMAQERAKVRQAMETGEEKYMPARDRGPQKRLVRDYIDARTGIGEWLLIIVLLFLFASFVMTNEARALVAFSLYFLMLAVVVECIWVARQSRKRIETKFGVGNMERGVRFYAAMRSLQMRRLRLPKPMINRGEYPS